MLMKMKGKNAENKRISLQRERETETLHRQRGIQEVDEETDFCEDRSEIERER